MGIEIHITDNSDQVLQELSKRMEQALTAIGMAAETNAKQEVTKVVYDTPERGYIRTGRLRNSLSHAVQMNEQAVYIGSNVEYAGYVELGTSRMKPRPYLKPAVVNYMSEYKTLAEQAFRG